MRPQHWCYHRSYSFHDGMFSVLCLVVVCVLFILGEVARAKVGLEGMRRTELHDVKQGINKKKKVEVTFSSLKYKNSKVMSNEINSL